MVKKAEEVKVGDYLYGIDGSEIEVTSVVFDDVNVYDVMKLDTSPNDVFFVNGKLTHNIKFPGDL